MAKRVQQITLKEPPAETVEEVPCEPLSEEWFQARLGLVTSSTIAALMVNNEEQAMRRKLLYRLAAEIITKKPSETYSNDDMKRGIEMEQRALDHYALVKRVDLIRPGVFKRTIPRTFGSIIVGASPDALVGENGIVQVKTMRPDLMVELILSKRMPTEHRWQCHCEMWVTGRQWNDLKVFYDGMPVSPVYRFERNEIMIRQMEDAVERFDYDLRKAVDVVLGA